MFRYCSTRFSRPCLLLVVVGAWVLPLAAQSVFRDVSGRALPSASPYAALELAEVRHLDLDADALRVVLAGVPLERSAATDASSSEGTEQLLELPLPSGKTRAFALTEYHLFTDGAQPGVRTFYGSALGDPEVRLRAEYTEALGLRALIDDRGRLSFVEPALVGQPRGAYIAFDRESAKRPTAPLTCGFDPAAHAGGGAAAATAPKPDPAAAQRRAGDCTFRSYRLAVATTAEYSAFFGATSAAQSNLVLAGVTTTVNRVNGVFENESAVRLQLLANTANSFYYDAANDPYTDGNAGQMLNANTPALNGVYGAANYDIGHVFGAVGGNGVAFLRSVCGGSKGGGVTLRDSPVGDPFDVDYVAHEMGHQFGANHTQNNDCNRTGASYEPGSASTIMGYAGICAPNVQANSDAYFHAASLAEIAAFVAGAGNACATALPSPNNAPAVSAGPDRTLPNGTPFRLTAAGSDPDGDALTYQWEHYDNGVAAMPPQGSSTTGPNFRSLTPTASPTRDFPRADAVRTGTQATWEVLPTVGRTSTFRVTARDNRGGDGGCTAEDDLALTWTSQGPFAVAAPSGSQTTWVPGDPATVTWSVAGTDAGAVGCATVDILLSTDGGFTYPTTLAAGVANAGSYALTVPSGTPLTNQARVLVRCATDVFYNVSPAPFTVSNVPSAVQCATAVSANVPLPIGPDAGTVTTSTVTYPLAFPIVSAVVRDLNGEHTFTSDLDVTLISPAGTPVTLFADECSGSDDFDLSLDQTAATSVANAPCPLTGGGTYRPEGSLDAVSLENAAGDWTLEIVDDANADGGQLLGWSLEICYDASVPLPVQLLTFAASAKTDHVALAWQTADERDHDRFEVERLREGARPGDDRWVTLGTVREGGSGATGRAYAFADFDVRPGQTYYYRLVQVDLDGTRAPSEVVSARVRGGDAAGALTLAAVEGALLLDAGRGQDVRVFSPSGRRVYAGAVGAGRTRLATDGWVSGVYVVAGAESTVRVFVP